MAVKLGLTDGTNFDPAQLPPIARGVTCYFCHNVKSVADTHNTGLVLAGDQTMRGGVKDPVSSPAHRSAFDKLMDSDANQSEICGSCHDVVTPRGVALERTYQEWQTTFFSQADPEHHLTCGACHMPSSTDVIADAPGLDVKSRSHGFHEHQWPAIDQALTPFPEVEAQAAGIQRDLDPAIAIVSPAPLGSNVQPGGICLDPPDTLSVRIDSIGTAHAWPTGAAQDRRAWLEPLLGLWDRAFKDDGTPAHFFWDIATLDSSQLLRPPITLDKNSPAFDHATVKTFSVGSKFADIVRITARVRIRPLSYAMLDDLVASGDLSPDVAGRLHTLDILGASSLWTVDTKGKGPAIFTNCNPQ
jgi:hypothetical protein